MIIEALTGAREYLARQIGQYRQGTVGWLAQEDERQLLAKLDKAIDEAREIEALRADRDSWRDQASARVADAVEFAEQAEALRADAEQYRWLRAQHWNDGTLAVLRSADLPLGVQTFSGQLLDDAITVRRMATTEAGG